MTADNALFWAYHGEAPPTTARSRPLAPRGVVTSFTSSLGRGSLRVRHLYAPEVRSRVAAAEAGTRKWRRWASRRDSGFLSSTMGCDGGTIPKRHELVKGPKKVEKVRRTGRPGRMGAPCARGWASADAPSSRQPLRHAAGKMLARCLQDAGGMLRACRGLPWGLCLGISNPWALALGSL